MTLSTIKRMASQLTKAGESRIWIDPSRIEDASKAVTKDDVRGLIRQGVVKVHKKKGVSRAIGRIRDRKRREGKGRGRGRKRGTHSTRAGGKKEWLIKVRAQRKMLKAFKEKGQISSNAAYRETYLKVKGGAFPDRARMVMFLKAKNYMKEAAEKPTSAAKPKV